ncbi:MAG: hypothetical protein H6732_09205 [Alphaproteobacteria bacterium]|nr:hypothetical protein [Alphaproteobacteria bacterium]
MSLLLPLALAGLSWAAETSAEEPAPARRMEEVVVYDDPYARWDHTRWHVRTQLGLPTPYLLYDYSSHEMEPVAIDLDFVMSCVKTWRRNKTRQEVDCTIDDLAVRAAPWRLKEPYGEEILAYLDQRMTGSRLQLLVADDGRVMGVDLEGFTEDNDRQKAIFQQARMLLDRALAGFHLRLPPRSAIRLGQWVEYNPTLFAIPYVPPQSARSMQEARAPAIYNTLGGSRVIHQLDPYKGHQVVQSVGEGTISLGGDEDNENFFHVKLEGVSLYDPKTGVMFERVYAVHGKATAGSTMAYGRADPRYFHVGSLRLLEEDEQVDVGATGMVARPAQTATSLPPWSPL